MVRCDGKVSLFTRLLEAAIAQWEANGITEESLTALHRVDVQISELPWSELGQAGIDVITVGRDGAGFGWFIDTTPGQNEEFEIVLNAATVQAGETSAAAGRIDLLTVISHEMGHILELDHSKSEFDLMAHRLDLGVRKLPKLGDLDKTFETELLDSLFDNIS